MFVRLTRSRASASHAASSPTTLLGFAATLDNLPATPTIAAVQAFTSNLDHIGHVVRSRNVLLKLQHIIATSAVVAASDNILVLQTLLANMSGGTGQKFTGTITVVSGVASLIATFLSVV